MGEGDGTVSRTTNGIVNLTENVSVYVVTDEDGDEEMWLRIETDDSVMYEQVFTTLLERIPNRNVFDMLSDVAQMVTRNRFYRRNA